MIQVKTYNSVWGDLLIGTFENQLCLCDWKYRRQRSKIDARIQSELQSEYTEGTNEIIKSTIQQLEEFASKKRQEFDIPILTVGTDFQKKVWDALLTIPYGKTKSYLEFSKQLGDPKAIRAVSSANGANAISIIIPCHRIVGSNGDLVGYAGGLNAKKKLLELESSVRQTTLF